jgi:hypothetical protein
MTIKRAPVSRRKKTSELVNSYGFSIHAIRLMEDMVPYLHPLNKAVDGWAKFLLASESREETRWQALGIPLLEDFYQQKVVLWKPKAITWQLPGARYSPDYLYIFEDGMRLNVEVKGSTFQPGYKDARAKMRMAATLYWIDRFMMVMPVPGTVRWELDEILPDKEFQTDLHVLAAEIERINAGDVLEE